MTEIVENQADSIEEFDDSDCILVSLDTYIENIERAESDNDKLIFLTLLIPRNVAYKLLWGLFKRLILLPFWR